MPLQKLFYKIIKSGLYCLLLLVAVGLLLEIAYRQQVIEFYQNAYTALNPPDDRTTAIRGDTSVLVMGDSFSAQRENYVTFLRSEYPDWQWVNAAVPGTGIRQHELFFTKRIAATPPDILIYQFYVGNDLTDIIHPYQRDSLTLIRNVYWWLSDRLLVVPYLNSVLAPLRQREGNEHAIAERPFKKEWYNTRTRTYIRANPQALEQTVLLEVAAEQQYQIWKNKFRRMLTQLPATTAVYLLVIPHCAQLSVTYLERYRTLGATVSEQLLEPKYPLVKRMTRDFSDVTIINPLPDFQQADQPTALYLPNDPHLTPTGQQVLTATISEMLSTQ